MTTPSIEVQSTFPEPVPAASQLAALPFLAAIEGFLRREEAELRLRLTLHRAMTRERQGYLQQVCDYLGPSAPKERHRGGRIFRVDEGIMGAAFQRSRVMRTKKYDAEDDLMRDLREDERRRGAELKPDTPLSWLAVPFLSAGGKPVLVLFADSHQFNFFADDERTFAVVDMCRGYCRLLDSLAREPFPTIRNFGFEPAAKVTGGQPAYVVQEALDNLAVPQLRHLRSFNFEAAVG